jgi:hypothetical protein
MGHDCLRNLAFDVNLEADLPDDLERAGAVLQDLVAE